jgi:HD-like signal output (HDOD) protein
MKAPTIEGMIQVIPQSLGSYGPVLEEIELALKSQQSSLASIGEVIQKDPDLTARLLRLANSSFYGFATRLSTVAEAVSLIGIQQVQDLIVVSSVVDRFTGISETLVSMNSFWRHSLAVGIGARTLAMERRLPKPEKFFVAGLLHDVGRLVLLSQATEASQAVFELYRQRRILLRDAEKQVLGYDHQQIAGKLLKYWNYPVFFTLAISNHHTPAAGEARMEASVVHVADHLANAMALGSSGERFIPPLDETAWSTLGLGPEVLSRVVTAIDGQIEAVEETFLKHRPEENRE